MIRIFLLTLCLLGASIPTLYAQHALGTAAPYGGNKPVGIDLSLWKRLSTQPNDSVGSTCLNIGLLSSMHRLNGLGVNILAGVVRGDVNGVQLSGLTNMVKGSTRGLQVAGITNINGNGMAGISLAGLVSLNGNEARGVTAAGLATITGHRNRGITVGGLMNFNGDFSGGMHVAGLANIQGVGYRGLTVSGLMNVAGSLQGLQLAGLTNITAKHLDGVQLSALANFAGEQMTGLQVAAFNMAMEDARGLQIGLVNYYRKSLKGFQLGLVNANPDTRVQLMAYGGNTTKINLAARFKNELFYTILGAGAPYLGFDDHFSGSLFYRAGLEIPLYRRLYLSGDLGFQHTETFSNRHAGYPERLYSLQARLNLELRLTDALGLFVSGGYGWDRLYSHASTYDKGALIEGGVIVFKY